MTAHRLTGLDNGAAQHVIAAARALEMGRGEQANLHLAPARQAYPDHPEVLRLQAGILSLRGDYPGARAAMDRALQQRPLDALYHNTMATVLGNAGEFDGAIRELQRACELEPGLATAWYNLGILLVRSVRNQEAADALQRAVALDPDNVDAHAQLGDLMRMRGDTAASAAHYRELIARRPTSGMAWWGLADLRTGELGSADIDSMRSLLRRDDISDDDRIAMGFALARAFDEGGRYAEALDTLKQAHAIARLRQHWNTEAFAASVAAARDAFTPPPAGAPDASLGREVLFIVGLPRSGTTLAEQILASHSSVEGAGELPDLTLELGAESQRHGQPFPRWAPALRPADWQRLGERYLERTARWRARRPRFTDKLPANWMYIGAIRAMLPGAHIVVCRRDPLETCFSCYRQHLAGNEYTRTVDDLAAFWREFDRTVSHFATLHPTHVYQHGYEQLLADPEAGIRALLAACGLPFEEACLRFYATNREVRSPSATQVRRPLQRNTARTQDYGALLDPLRVSLGLPAFGT